MLPIYVLDCAASDREGMGEIHIPIEDGTQLNAQASRLPETVSREPTLAVHLIQSCTRTHHVMTLDVNRPRQLRQLGRWRDVTPCLLHHPVEWEENRHCRARSQTRLGDRPSVDRDDIPVGSHLLPSATECPAGQLSRQIVRSAG